METTISDWLVGLYNARQLWTGQRFPLYACAVSINCIAGQVTPYFSAWETRCGMWVCELFEMHVSHSDTVTLWAICKDYIHPRWCHNVLNLDGWWLNCTIWTLLFLVRLSIRTKYGIRRFIYFKNKMHIKNKKNFGPKWANSCSACATNTTHNTIHK